MLDTLFHMAFELGHQCILVCRVMLQQSHYNELGILALAEFDKAASHGADKVGTALGIGADFERRLHHAGTIVLLGNLENVFANGGNKGANLLSGLLSLFLAANRFPSLLQCVDNIRGGFVLATLLLKGLGLLVLLRATLFGSWLLKSDALLFVLTGRRGRRDGALQVEFAHEEWNVFDYVPGSIYKF